MVVLASDTLTGPLLPRTIHLLPRKVSTSSSHKHSSSSTTSSSNSTKTKIIIAVVIVSVVVLLVLALLLFLYCRRRRQRLAQRHQNRSSMETIAENQGYGGGSRGFVGAGMVRKLTQPLDDQEQEQEQEQEQGGRYHGSQHEQLYNREEQGGGGEREAAGGFENVPLEGDQEGGHTMAGLTRPGDIYRYGDRQSRFSP